MKKYSVLLLAISFFAISCEGPAGPQGPPGPQGLPAPIGQAFRKTVTFTPPYYSEIIEFPKNIVVLKSDAVLVYLHWTVDEGTGYDVWQPLPVSVFFKDGGEMQYAFDHTIADVRIFLKGDIDLNTLGPDWTENQLFRIVILPADYVLENKVNLNDMQAVMELVDQSNIKRYGVHELQVNDKN